MSHVVKIAVLSAITLLGLETMVPTPAAASPMVVQSRMQQLMDRSRRRQARLEEDRRYAEEEARLAAAEEAEAARLAQAEVQANAQAVTAPTAPVTEKPAEETEDEAETPTPTPQI